MGNHQPYRHAIDPWQIAPYLLAPPAAVAGVCLLYNLPLTPFLFTFALTSLALLALAWPRQTLRWAVATAALASCFLLAASASSMAG